MKLLITFFLIFSRVLLIAQKQDVYAPIDSIGWNLPVIPDLDIDPEKDPGSVKYLLTVSKEGVIKKVEILSNTFREEAESKVRYEVKNLKLSRKKAGKTRLGYKGTLEISVGTCMDARDNKN